MLMGVGMGRGANFKARGTRVLGPQEAERDKPQRQLKDRETQPVLCLLLGSWGAGRVGGD